MPARSLTYAAAVAADLGDVLRCPLVRGLELQCKRTGKMWYLRYRHAGERRAPKLGEFPTLQIDAARDAARAILQAVARGEDPSAARNALRDAPRVRDLWVLYERQTLISKKPRTQDEYRRNYTTHIAPALADVRVAEVDLERVNKLLTHIAATHVIASNRVAALLSGMFKLACRSDVQWARFNPVKGSFRVKERKRRRHITRDEFPAIGAALRALSVDYPAHVTGVVAILLGGTRVTEMLTARRSQFDPDRGCITLDEHKTDRTGVDRIIWLPAPVVSALQSFPAQSPWLFPYDASLTGHLDRYSLGYFWREKVLPLAGVSDLRLQDLRRTYASVALSRGASLDQIGDLFGHADKDTTGHYAFLVDERASEIVEDTGREMQRLLDKPSK